MKIIKTILAVPATLIGATGLGLLFGFMAVKIYGKRLVNLVNVKLG